MNSLDKVVQSGMCAGCGLCVAASSDMQIDSRGFARPIRFTSRFNVDPICPGRSVAHLNRDAPYDVLWGPLELAQVGWAIDPQIRQLGSSGGVLTALLVYLLTHQQVDAVIQTGASSDDPIRNETRLVTKREDLLANAGSRYAPSSPLSVINDLLGDGRRYAFVGKPCDVAALRAFLNQHAQFKEQFPYLLSFMCAGVPSEHGTLALLERMQVDRSEVSSLRYRGEGWPGMATAKTVDGRKASLSYNESWGSILNRFLQPRCKVCADGIGEAADLVCGDAWFETSNGYPSFEERPGRSLVFARTSVGSSLLGQAVQSGEIAVNEFDLALLQKIQPYQAFRKRTAIYRFLALSLFFRSFPRFHGYQLSRAMLYGGIKEKLKTFLGTVYRLLKGRL